LQVSTKRRVTAQAFRVFRRFVLHCVGQSLNPVEVTCFGF